MTKEEFTDSVFQAEKSMYRVAKSFLHQDEDCADAIQSAILNAYEMLDTLRHEKYLALSPQSVDFRFFFTNSKFVV